MQCFLCSAFNGVLSMQCFQWSAFYAVQHQAVLSMQCYTKQCFTKQCISKQCFLCSASPSSAFYAVLHQAVLSMQCFTKQCYTKQCFTKQCFLCSAAPMRTKQSKFSHQCFRKRWRKQDWKTFLGDLICFSKSPMQKKSLHVVRLFMEKFNGTLVNLKEMFL